MVGWNCGDCCKPIGGQEGRINCDGRCEEVFHLSCVKLTEYDHHRCADSDNLLWLCDRCVLLFRNQFSAKDEPVRMDCTVLRNDNNNSIEATLHRLQLEISEMKDSIAELKKTAITEQASGTCNDVLPCTSTPTSHLSNVNNSIINDKQSTIISASELSVGSKIVAPSLRTRSRFWMFFTRVAKHVTENDVSKMVVDSLNLSNPPDVVKVTPRWINEHDVRYNSYKIGLQSVYREIALKESTWPCGLMFKEFENHSSPHSHYITLWEP